MRCYICDTELTDAEIQFSEDPKHRVEPCKTCSDTAFDAAYSQGFTPGADPTGLVEETGDSEQLDFPFVVNDL